MVTNLDGRARPAPQLGDAFDTARAEQRAALIGYLPTGYPSVRGSIAAMEAMVEGGVDAVEVGLPHSDPVLDGPAIRSAVEAALHAGTRIAHVMRAVSAVAATGAPAVCMSYWNPIARYGVEQFAHDLAGAGGCGLIAPDLPAEEAEGWRTASDRNGLDRVFLAAHSSSTERLTTIATASKGFVYATGVTGVSGSSGLVPARARHLVTRVRQVTDLPVCVGLGISTGEQAAQVAEFADGVIVGSAFVRRLLDAPDERTGIRGVHRFAADLTAAVRSAPAPVRTTRTSRGDSS
ncbi:tryptophan synthase subunit alpha [Streptomyces monticola]|uniref:Tryptophan synthase alpha chain n=1 Tax=Streptomyces monticola TaxID=2666263 RepID=A0ABW2JQI3_9ACTN